ncbi:hypothetical protein HEQ60_01040 [Haematospirillum sp. H1815]|uniref:hypothetical protein n=1 Tax=Haematospirillum sp. H1815 TaxID=2723108 RepID=UPI00143B2255|nr:hypothetical protein [Haematospirillum sp. H1815]NKD76361.1 hypothetical protein [Haematospirillum sp. H1815]
MSATPTASHAWNLFSLTMENRFGSAWRSLVEPDSVAALAEEIAVGFGGMVAPVDAASQEPDPHDATLWRFPDGSCVATGAFGLRREIPLPRQVVC